MLKCIVWNGLTLMSTRIRGCLEWISENPKFMTKISITHGKSSELSDTDSDVKIQNNSANHQQKWKTFQIIYVMC